MNARKHGLWKKAAATIAAYSLLLGSIAPALAQGPDEHGVVGWEVRSTNTPGGGGELKSQGVTGKTTPWSIAEVGPSVAGSAVVNIVIRYYHCEECWKKAKEEKKKKEDEAKKKKEEEKKKKEEEKKKKKTGDKPPVGPDVPTFDPRTHELKDGKVVPKDPKDIKPGSLAPNPTDHPYCEMPPRFECGEHYQWWLKNHEHRTEAPKAQDQKLRTIDTEMQPMSLQGSSPMIVLTGTVISGEEASASVLDAKGALLTGVVVELPDGKQATTDENGRVKFSVPQGMRSLVLGIAGTKILERAWVRDSGGPSAPNSGQAPQPRLDCPEIVQPGNLEQVFMENAPADSQLWIDGKPADVLSWSESGCMIRTPSNLQPGTHRFELVKDGQLLDIATAESIRIEIDPPKTMAVGQNATYQVRVIGTDRKVELSLSNLSQGTARLSGDSADGMVQSSGGKNNVAKIQLSTQSAGQIQVSVRPWMPMKSGLGQEPK